MHNFSICTKINIATSLLTCYFYLIAIPFERKEESFRSAHETYTWSSAVCIKPLYVNLFIEKSRSEY